ncbi:MAG: amino acid ABC transporter substrate-binding protein [Nitrospira sp.]|nr:amino acid ABC transporter substrate-binding protein [Nitrospira sp.]
MGFSDRHKILTRDIPARLCWLALGVAITGCGLMIDAAQKVWPIVSEQTGPVCQRGRLQVGMAFEPFRPFVFPAIFTDEGLRVTGLDVELVREIAADLSTRCGGKPIIPVIHLVRFRDLFVELNEGKLDLFVSAVAANVPAPTRAGLAYSTPYFNGGGLAAIVRRPEISELILARLDRQRDQPPSQEEFKGALEGLTVAVQEGRGAHYFAQANLAMAKVVLCDSLPAAFESEDPSIDVILGGQPILDYTVTWVRKDWQRMMLGNRKPLLLSREQYAVVMAEESYWLRWAVNDLLFRLNESGRLEAMRRRWLEESYAYPRRAAKEGLPFAAENMPQHYDQGRCRWAERK